MIPQRYVRQYRKGKGLDDHRWMKKLKRRELLDLINDLRPRPKLWPEMRKHQLVSFLLGVLYGFDDETRTGGGFSYWLDMGSGKTLIALELMKYWHQCGLMERGLVFTLSDKAYPTWENQVKRFEIGLPVTALEGSSADKWATLDSFGKGIVLCSYPGAVRMCSYKQRGKLMLKRDLIDELSADVGVLILDESTRAGHPKSLTHQMCDYIAEFTRNRYALAGLPFGRDPTMLFHQQKIVDGGESFGSTLGMFREAFFTKEQNIWAKSRFAFNYTFDENMTPLFSKRMQHRSITYEEHEVTDVPKIQEIKVPVRLRGEARQYYERVNEEIVELAKSGTADLKATKNVFLRMRQITSGFLGFKHDETGERARIVFKNNAKLDALLEELDGVPDDRKAVIFYEYTWSGQRIHEELRKRGVRHSWLWSGTKNYRKELNRFLTARNCTRMILQNQIGSFSLDGLQDVANYVFYYESPVPVIVRRQSEKRVKRPGQKRRVYQYDMVCEGTVDEKILTFHKEGSDLMRSVRKDPRILL